MTSRGQRVAIALAALAGSVIAPCRAGEMLGGAVSLVSDEVFRGLSLSCGRPALQGDVHVGNPSGAADRTWYAGVWGAAGLGSAPCGRAREVNVYAGLGLTPLPENRLSATYIRYLYPGGSPALYDGHRYDYDELLLSWTLRDQLQIGIAATPDAVRYDGYAVHQNRFALSGSLTLREPLSASLSAALGAGYDRIADPSGTGFGYWSLGGAYRRGRLGIELSYVRASPHAVAVFYPPVARARVVAAVTCDF